MKTAIIGGGAAGFFLAVNLKEMMPEMEVTIFERSRRVLAKVEISGGGRCNCTNSFEGVTDLSQVYPRGHRLLRRLFNVFDHRAAYAWFERHGVRLTTQDDHCVFPQSQDSHTMINCFLDEARRHGVHIETNRRIVSVDELHDYDFIAVTTGGSPRAEGLEWLRQMGHQIETPVPSLFTFTIVDTNLRSLMGTVANHACCQIPGTKLRSEGPLLITHWGMSGPATLKLSSHAARLLHDQQYHAPLSVNWTGLHEQEVLERLTVCMQQNAGKRVQNVSPFDLTQRLWNFLLDKSIEKKAMNRWNELGKKDVNRLVNVLCNDTYQIVGRAAFKEEFVTCGGVSLKSINPNTMESRVRRGLFFAGEVLDIDGVTGGFNFQAAWTTAYVAAQSIASNK